MSEPRDDDAPIEANGSESVAGAPVTGEQSGIVHAPTEIAVAPVTIAPPTDDRVSSTDADDDGPRWQHIVREIMSGNVMLSVLAVVVSLIVGGILIAFTDERVQAASGYFFARPLDTLAAIGAAVGGAYWALFQGSVLNFTKFPGIGTAINESGWFSGDFWIAFGGWVKPITDTLHFATPLIAAGLGVALAFRVGLFNIGGRGQMLAAAAAAGWVGFSFELPAGIHLIAVLLAGIIAGALWGALAGLLKAYTGAHEVIVTIMLNFVMLWFVSWLLRTPGLLQAPGSNNPISPGMLDTAVLPRLLGQQFNLNWGFVIMVAAVIFCSWLLNRSSLGFQYRALGLNANAALNAGMNVKRLTTTAMLFAGGFMGLAGAMQVSGVVTTGFTSGIDAGVGFDAITVALLGRSTPWGTFAAGVLFGAFKAGGFRMQAAQGVPIDIVLVVQSLIVLFIAAPPLIRAMFGIRLKGAKA